MSTSRRRAVKPSSGSNRPSSSRKTAASAAATSLARSGSSSNTKRKSAPRGKRGSGVEVTNVSSRGFWLLLDGRELFLDFKQFPWFLDATIRALTRIERPHPWHLCWPDLDVDLEVESIEHPERYPLVSRSPAIAVSERDTRRLAAPTHRPKQGTARR
jgi:hypothetical protein